VWTGSEMHCNRWGVIERVKGGRSGSSPAPSSVGMRKLERYTLGAQHSLNCRRMYDDYKNCSEPTAGPNGCENMYVEYKTNTSHDTRTKGRLQLFE
jgi:hypothetical protein